MTHDYNHHYREFCRRLQADHSLKFTAYCQEAAINWRRLYDWMSRRKISLKQLYKGVGQPMPEEEKDKPVKGRRPESADNSSMQTAAFIPLHVEPQAGGPASPMEGIIIRLADGSSVEIGSCTPEALVTVMGGPLGKSRV